MIAQRQGRVIISEMNASRKIVNKNEYGVSVSVLEKNIAGSHYNNVKKQLTLHKRGEDFSHGHADRVKIS